MKKLLIPLLFILVVIGITMFAVFNPTSFAYNQQNEIPYSEFIEAVRNNAVTERTSAPRQRTAGFVLNPELASRYLRKC